MRAWLDLPYDTPLGYFHAPVGEGGLGVLYLRASIPSMCLQRLDGLRFPDHPGCAPALELLLLVDFRRRALVACRYQGQELLSKKVVQKMWAGLLHRSNDEATLRDSGKVPGAYRWVSEGTHILRKRQFMNLLKPRINAMPTLERTSQGRGVNLSCRTGCLAPESLGTSSSAATGGTVDGSRGTITLPTTRAGCSKRRNWHGSWFPLPPEGGKVLGAAAATCSSSGTKQRFAHLNHQPKLQGGVVARVCPRPPQSRANAE